MSWWCWGTDAVMRGSNEAAVMGGGGGILDETHPPDLGPTRTQAPL